MSDETKVIDVLIGPYRGQRLTVSAADAESAVNNHWATEADTAPPPPDEQPHPPLSDEERQAALDSANEWAQKQWAIAQGEPDAPPPEPPPEGAPPVRRDMKPDETSGRYATRDADQKAVPDEPSPPERPQRRR